MKAFIVLLIIFIFQSPLQDKIRDIEYNGKLVKTTYKVPKEFYGKYSGSKSGYLQLNEDGTGIYKYDIFGFAPADCKREQIAMEWGFLWDNDHIVTFQREYGLSYPILMKSTGDTWFQGCRKEVMLDFIMFQKNGTLEISSSDDWVK